MKKTITIFAIAYSFLFALICSYITTKEIIKSVEEKKIKQQEQLEESIKEKIIQQYHNNSYLYYPILLQENGAKDEYQVYTAIVTYYDLQYTYQDVWIVTIKEEKIEIRKVREK